MEEKNKSESRLSQNVIIAIIGAVATILAALIPTIISMNSRSSAPAYTVAPPTFTSIPPTIVPSDTPIPPTATTSFTFTPEPPTATPTTPVGIYDVYLAMDGAGDHKTTVFGTKQYVYIFFSINDPSGLNQISTTWVAVDAAGFLPNTKINQTDDTINKPKSSVPMLYLPSWPAGKYKVEISLNGSLANTQEFEIKK